MVIASRARPASTNFLDFFILKSSFANAKLYFFPDTLPGGMAGEKGFKRSEAADGTSACGLNCMGKEIYAVNSTIMCCVVLCCVVLCCVVLCCVVSGIVSGECYVSRGF